MTIAFLGPRGTNSEDAAILHGGPDAELSAFSSMPALTSAVETGMAEVAVLPIENSIEGPVSTTLDLLIHETPLRICAEVVVPIQHVLVTVEGARLDQIATVVSHPQGLAQCRRFLERFLPTAEQVAWLSTAGAIKEVVDSGDPTRAAIGPNRAQELYGGQVLARDIQDIRSNLTRFVVLARNDSPPTGRDKTSLGFTVKENVPGILFQVFSRFAERDVQLTKIESRPIKGRLGLYVFLLDFEGHRADPVIAEILDELGGLLKELKVFGSYPRFPLEQFDDLYAPPGLL
ncbi:MAG TPA: prephenate dehydratase [Thermomicrobiales bacterium]|nr:prephenate dehydratase [Thermomicrobiales bacterium]